MRRGSLRFIGAAAIDARLSSRDNKPRGRVSKFARPARFRRRGGEFMRTFRERAALVPRGGELFDLGEKAGGRPAIPGEGT